MKASGQIASYLSVLAVSPRWRYGRRAGQILPFWRQGWPCFRGRAGGHDSSSHVVLPFRMFVVHVVAGLAVIPVARVATGVHVLGPAQGALVRGRCLRGFLRLRSGRKFDDLVVRVTTVSGERRWRYFRWGRRSALLLLVHFLLLLCLYQIFSYLESRGIRRKRLGEKVKDLRTSTQWGMDLAMRNRVDGFEMAIGRHFSAPGFCEERNIIFIFLFDFDQRRRRRESPPSPKRKDKSSRLFIATGTFLRAVSNRGDKLAALLTRVQLPNDTGYSCHRTLGWASERWLLRLDERIFLWVDHRGKRDAGRYHAGTGWNRIYFCGGKNRVPRLEIKSSRTSRARIYLLELTRLRRKYKYRITILFTNSFNVSSKVDSDFSFQYFFFPLFEEEASFVYKWKERKREKIDQFRIAFWGDTIDDSC